MKPSGPGFAFIGLGIFFLEMVVVITACGIVWLARCLAVKGGQGKAKDGRERGFASG